MENGAKVAGDTTLHEGTISADWLSFEGKLAEMLGALEEDQFLIIPVKSGWGYVQFAGQGLSGLRAESVSNNYLPEPHALSADQIAALEKLGWLPPTGTPEESTPKQQPEGSPNFFRDFAHPVPFGDVARLAVRTLTEVLGIPHPGYLGYEAFDKHSRPILMPTLGLTRRPPVAPPAKPREDTPARVREFALEAIREASGIADLDFGEEGHLALRFGSAVVLVRVEEEPLRVSLVSPILGKVAVSDLLVDRLNDLNANVHFARLFASEDTVYAAIEVFASPFVAEHVVDACLLLGNLADDVDEMLQREFGGGTPFGEFRFKSQMH